MEGAGCEVRKCYLIKTEDSWQIDFADLEKAFQEGVKVMMLCNPHNPVGRIWTCEELSHIVELAKKYGVQMISDEIHADLEMPGYKNTSLLKLDPDAIVFISATKTFNLAALNQSSVLIGNPTLRDGFIKRMQVVGATSANLFGRIAQQAAYEHGAAWLDALLLYLDENRQYVENFLKQELPMITCSRLQGTYLMWLDMSALGMAHDEMLQFCYDCGFGIQSGKFFDSEKGENYVRLNIGTPRKNLEQAFRQLKDALANR